MFELPVRAFIQDKNISLFSYSIEMGKGELIFPLSEGSSTNKSCGTLLEMLFLDDL